MSPRHTLHTLLLCMASTVATAAVVGFEDLPARPARNDQTQLYFANNDNDTYQGITWDRRLRVVGDAYRVDTATPGPLYGLPHSGQYFITNEGDGNTNNGVLITTTLVLTGAWFGRNEYYGYGAGADQVTVHALAGSSLLASVVFDLPELLMGQPEVLSFVDTSRFAALSGITGYRIDRRELATASGNWVADDFTFSMPIQLPEPRSIALMLAGFGLLGWRYAPRRR